MAKKSRKRNLVALWQGKVRKVIEQSSGPEVRVLLNLIWHPGMTSEQKYLVLDRAIFDVWSEREADREEEANARRKRAREQARQEKEFSEPADAGANAFPQTSIAERVEPIQAEPLPLDPAGSSWSPHEEVERGPRAPEHDSMSPEK